LLLAKIKDKSARIGVIGMGYVGLPVLLEFGKAGFPVTGFDIDPIKVGHLSGGRSYIRHIPSESIQEIHKTGKADFTTDFSKAHALDCILICVPTPLNRNREPDLSFIVSTARTLSPNMRKGQLVVLESTTYPGTTQEVLARELEASNGFKAAQDFFLAYSPEREDPNNPEFRTKNIPKLVGADDEYSKKAALALYGSIVETTIPVSGTRVAEAAKLMENIFRSVNIALVNELKIIFDKMGIDVWEVIEAASTKPFGFMKFLPGPGLGGHCIPVDPFYLSWKAREFGTFTRFIELAGEVNVSMPDFVFHKIQSALNAVGKSLNGSSILILGMAYKRNVDDDRESVSYKIMDLLVKSEAEVDYNDPFIPVVKSKREYPQYRDKMSVSLENLEQYDLTVILTDHSVYDYEEIVKKSNLVVDTRNACAGIQSHKIIKA